MNIWILVIDDDEATRRSITTLLNDAGYSAIAAGSGSEGVRLWEETEPELVIADVMPTMRDSIDTIVELRRGGSEAKILAMAGLRHAGSADIAELLRQLGADDVLLKPCEPEVLLAKVDRMICLPAAQSAA